MLTDFVQQLQKLSNEEIEQFELALKKEKTKRKINEVLISFKESKQKGAEKLKFFSKSKDFISALNED